MGTSMYGNCTVQVAYGLFLPMPPAVPANLFGSAACIYYLSSCWWHAWRQGGCSPWDKAAAATTAGAVGTSLLAFLYAGLQLHVRAAEYLGSVALVLNVAMFASPLTALRQVFRDRS